MKEVVVSDEIKFVYRANICGDVLTDCSGNKGGATETLKIPSGENCRVLGKTDKATIEESSAAVSDFCYPVFPTVVISSL